MTINNISLIILSLLFSGILSYILTKVSRKIGYNYGSVKKEIFSIIISVLYVGVLSYFLQKFNIELNVKGEIYFLFCIIASTFAISSSFIDIEYKEIPDLYNLIIASLGFLLIFVAPEIFNSTILTGSIMFGMYFLIMSITKAMGGGDVKMAGALGLLIPVSHLNKFLLYPFAFGSVVSLCLIAFKKRNKNDKIAFGPYIAVGYLFTVFIYWINL